MVQKLLAAFAACFLLFGGVSGLQNSGASFNSGDRVESSSSTAPSTSELGETKQTSSSEETQGNEVIPSSTETPTPAQPPVPDLIDSLEPDLAEQTVSNWKELNTALANPTVTKILVTKDIVADATATGATIKRSVTVDFGHHLLDINSRFFLLDTNGDLHVQNILLKGTTGNLVQSVSDTATAVKLTLSGTFDTTSDNTKNIARLVNGSVEFNGVTMRYEHNNDIDPAIWAKNLLITNQSNIVANSIKFFYSTIENTQVLLDGQSYIETNSNKGSTAGQAWRFSQKVDIWIKGNSKLKATGDILFTDVTGGVFIVEGNKSTLNVAENSTFDIYSKQSPAVIMQSQGGSFNVDGHSLIKLRSDGQANTYGATLRFRLLGGMTFNITNQSTIDIEKTAGDAPAIRLFGNNNAINVSGGSDFTVRNRGDGTPNDPGELGRNQGIQYDDGTTGNQFNLMDAGSNVKIVADNGTAIDGDTNQLTITAGKETFFTARGKTKSAGAGIFSTNTSGSLNFKMTGVSYFDFRNDRPGGGNIMGAGTNSTFTSQSSDVSFWQKGSNLDGDPLYTWYDLNYKLKGTNLDTLESTDNSEMQNKFAKLTNYSRMSANNQSAVIDELRVPTNADKYIYAHGSVPESEGELRDANTGEVLIKIGLFDPVGNLVQELTGTSIGTPTSVYGEEARRGLFKIPAPQGDFLKAGFRLKVLGAWRGTSNGDWLHPSPQEAITAADPQVYDVTPPAPTVLGGNLTTISPYTKTISGTGEIGANVLLALNGATVSQTTTVAADGSYQLSLPDGLKKGDVLTILLQDRSGSAAVKAPPATNSTIGNIQPLTDMSYHDATFLKGSSVTVTGILALTEVPRELDFGQRKVSNKTQDYRPTLTGKLVITDSRGDPKSPWQLKLKEETGLTAGSYDLSGLLSYRNQQGEIAIGSEAAIVESGKFTADGLVTVSDTWQNDRGLHLRVPVAKQLVSPSEYHGKLAWSLEDVPGNQ